MNQNYMDGSYHGTMGQNHNVDQNNDQNETHVMSMSYLNNQQMTLLLVYFGVLSSFELFFRWDKSTKNPHGPYIRILLSFSKSIFRIIRLFPKKYGTMPPTKRKQTTSNSNSTKKPRSNDSQQNNDIEINDDVSKPFNLKIMSWNVNGCRAALKNGVMDYLNKESCDILCLQETKCNDKTIPKEWTLWETFPHKYYCHSKQDGYAGVALFSKEKPLKVDYGLGISEYDDEGRIITAHYDKFILVNAYVVNAGQGLKRLDFKVQFDKDFREYLQNLDKEKPVILCGDLNCAHKEIDLENPKTNHKTAGFTPEERQDFTKLLEAGFLDSFRLLYPDKPKCYTYWGYRFNCRAKDIGWRLDYFLISSRLEKNLVDNRIRKHVLGSDHCPIILYMDL